MVNAEEGKGSRRYLEDRVEQLEEHDVLAQRWRTHYADRHDYTRMMIEDLQSSIRSTNKALVIAYILIGVLGALVGWLLGR